jgi:hypothetical protein
VEGDALYDAEIPSVTDRRSGIAAVMSRVQFSHGWMGLGDPQKPMLRGFGL